MFGCHKIKIYDVSNTWGANMSNKIEFLQKKAIRVLYFKSENLQLLTPHLVMKQHKLSDLYTCNLYQTIS